MAVCRRRTGLEAMGSMLLLLVVFGFGLGATSCSVAVELDACTQDQDCPEGYGCTEDRLCLDSSAQCYADEHCVELFGDDQATCSDGICQGDTALIGGPCQQLYGAAGQEDAFIIGVVMQFSGVGAGFGQPMLDAIRVGMRDFNSIGGIDGRPIGLVACDTEADDDIAREAAEHLVDTAGVEAIIGFNSSQVLDIGPEVTAPNDVLLMSPSATAVLIPPSGHNGLIWRTAPSDESQSIALENLLLYTANDYLPQQGIDEANIAVLVRRSDQWAEGLRDHLNATVPAQLEGGTDRYTTASFANVGAGDPADYTDVAADLAASEEPPDIVVVLGSADSWKLIDDIDRVLADFTDDDAPLFIGADAMKNAQEASQASSTLEHRIWGTGPRSVAEIDYTPYTIFRLKFEEEMNDDADNYQFVANAFDALYTVALGAAGGGFTGPEIADGLRKLDSGQNIRPSATETRDAIEILSGGGTINYQGASGPINFDEDGNPEPMPIALWCFEDSTVPERGQLYSQVTGEFTPLTCDPDEEVDNDGNFDDPDGTDDDDSSND